MEAYRRLFPDLRLGRKAKEQQAQCPFPDHPDTHPTMSMNYHDDTWKCHGTCDRGGDILTLGAIRFNYDVDSYQSREAFPGLVRDLADAFGIEPVVRIVTQDETPEPEARDSSRESENCAPTAGTAGKTAGQSQESSSEPSREDDSTVAPVITLVGEEDDEDDLIDLGKRVPVVDWVNLLPEDTFLGKFMRIARGDDMPEANWFWHGMLAVGLAVGKNAFLSHNNSMPVYPNLFVCFYSGSGQGKSRPARTVNDMLHAAIPFDINDPDKQHGVMFVANPESAQAVIRQFHYPIHEDDDPKKPIIGYHDVRGLLRYGELATLIGKSHYSGSTLKTQLHDFYDCEKVINSQSQTHGRIEAHDAFMSVTATAQPRAIREVLAKADVDNGFANRWVYVIGHDKRAMDFPPNLDFTPCVLSLQAIHEWAEIMTRPIGLEPAAYDTFAEFFYDKLAPIRTQDEPMLKRLDLTIRKIITIFSCNAREADATVDTVEKALSLYDYLVAGYRMLDADMSTSEQQELQEAIMTAAKKCVKKGINPTFGNIWSTLSMRHRDSSRVRRTLDDLQALGQIKIESTAAGRRGRPGKSFVPQ